MLFRSGLAVSAKPALVARDRTLLWMLFFRSTNVVLIPSFLLPQGILLPLMFLIDFLSTLTPTQCFHMSSGYAYLIYLVGALLPPHIGFSLNTKNETKVNDPYACAGSSRPLSR